MNDLQNFQIEGISDKKLKRLEKLNIYSFEDILKSYPRDYEDRTIFVDTKTSVDGQKACMVLLITNIRTSFSRRGLEITEITGVDDFGTCKITVFNQKYLIRSLSKNKVYVFYGTISKDANGVTMSTPAIELFSNTSSKILPIYNLTSGITQFDMRIATKKALEVCQKDEILPQNIIEKYKLLDINEALQKIHYPKNEKDINDAKRRLVFEQMFLYFIKLHYLHYEKRKNLAFKLELDDFSEVLQNISFDLTQAQIRSINECISDMKRGYQMSRLLQGDVGSGKTIVATILSYITSKNKKQVAFMVPTEILANQHFEEINEIFNRLSLKAGLLTGSTTAKNKKLIKQQLKNGEIDIIIGTHAIITDDTEFLDLGLVIVDEQHRFGVLQRAKLTAKGENPHILVMSATPIPRTLSLILFGDLDISIIDELPKGRIPIETFVVDETKRKRMFSFIKKHIDEKEQVYIVCPLVSESDKLDVKDAEQYYANLSKLFVDYNVGLIHGKMKAKEKDEIMEEFSSGNIDILVSTTVIEVGVNVPNATIMVVENAERFGLFALHQLRGRVGRGDKKSYCLLFSNSKSHRLEILTKSNDGFYIAQEDLKIRGSGDFFGSRQSGASTIDILSDELNVKILKPASAEALEIIEKDPKLENYPKLQQILSDDLVVNKLNIFT